jgi:CotS family spore coat protein
MQGMDREINERYGLEVRGLLPYRDCSMIIVPTGRKVLKKMTFSAERLLFINGAKEHLASNGYSNIDRYMLTHEGLPYFNFDNCNYTVADYIDGRELGFENDSDVQKAACALADMHRASRGYIPPEGCKVQDDLSKQPVYFRKRLDDIKKLKKQAKKGKGKFDYLFMKYVEYFMKTGEETINAINESNYDSLVSQTREEGLFCHHDYTHHNIISSENKISVINFDYCCFDLKVYDLANFIRRKMRKCSWDIDKALLIIDAYAATEPLSDDDLAVMGLILKFPQKFWRVVNRYYNSRRSWSEKSYIAKLQEVIDEVPQHKTFIENYYKRY